MGQKPDVEQTLAERMREYEDVTKLRLNERSYTIVRVDGRSFSRYTKHLAKPFDLNFIEAMNQTAAGLAHEVAGTKLAYVQSDEISLVLTDFDNENTQAWMGGSHTKVVSLTAATATMIFNRHMPKHHPHGSDAMFDSRVWNLPSLSEVTNYLLWRQRDAIKNSVSMMASAHFSHRELHKKTTEERKAMLAERSEIWEDLPAGIRQGRVVFRKAATKQVEHPAGKKAGMVQARPWVTVDAPGFDHSTDGIVAGTVPDINPEGVTL